MPDQYFYRTLGMEFGPVSLTAIRELIGRGTLSAGDQYCGVGGAWRDVSFLIAASTKTGFPSKDGSVASTQLIEPTRPEPRSPTGTTPTKQSDVRTPAGASRPLNHLEKRQTNSGAVPTSSDMPVTSNRWIYRTKEGAVGPIDTEQFLLAVRNGIVVPQTFVRLADSLQWMTAAEIAGLEFPQSSPITPAGKSAKPDSAATHLPANIEMQRLFAECLDSKQFKKTTPRRDQLKSSSSDLNVQITSGLSAAFCYAWGAFRSTFELILSLLNRAFWYRAVQVSVFVAVAVAVAPPLIAQVADSLITQRQVYADLAEMFAKLKELRSKDVDPASWEAFQKQSEEKLATLLPKLNRDAVKLDSVSMSLLRVGRDYLPRLLKDAKPLTTKTAKDAETHLTVVKFELQKQSSPGQQWDFWTASIVFLDVFGVCAVLVYFGKNWWLRTVATR